MEQLWFNSFWLACIPHVLIIESSSPACDGSWKNAAKWSKDFYPRQFLAISCLHMGGGKEKKTQTTDKQTHTKP